MEPSGGAEPSHPGARHGVWDAELSAQGAAGWSQGLPGDKALRGGQKQPEKSGERPDLEGASALFPHLHRGDPGTKSTSPT